MIAENKTIFNKHQNATTAGCHWRQTQAADMLAQVCMGQRYSVCDLLKVTRFAMNAARVHTVSREGRHQTHGSNSVRPLTIFKILSLADSVEN